MKAINFNQVDLDGDSTYILKQFERQAKSEGWTPEEIKGVVDEAGQGDYDHLLNTLLKHSNVDEEEDNDIAIVIDHDSEDDEFVYEHPYEF